MSLHIASAKNPYHLSAGAVVVNPRDNTIACQYAKKYLDLKDLYVLMRETLEANESLEQTVARGLMEEMGIEAEIKNYIGSIISSFMRGGEKVEKTTAYYLCELTNFDITKRDADDSDAGNEIVWLSIDSLIEKSKDQFKRTGRDDFDESIILQRVKNKLS